MSERLASFSGFKYCLITILIISITYAITLLGCGSDSPTDPDDNGNGNADLIGPAGGTVTDTSGAAVVIPQGALTPNTIITIKTYGDQFALPDSMRSSLLGIIGASDFKPDGLQFDKPVTITIPSNIPLTPGEQFPLWIWNAVSQGWEQTEFMATAANDGLSFSAEVTHFSTYSGDNGWGADGIFDDLDVDHWMEAQQAFQDWYSGFTWSVRNIGYSTQIGDCCMEVTGLKFSIDYRGDITYKNDEVFGKLDDYNRYEKFEVTRGSIGSGFYLHLEALVYWSGTEPDHVTVTSNVPLIDLMEGEHEATVTAKPVCDGYYMPGVQVEFSLTGPGSISPASGTTNGSGEAKTTFTATDTGTVTVKGTANTCQNEGEIKTSEGTVQILVDSCTQWELGVKIDFTHNAENWTFTDKVSMTIPVEIDEFGVTGESGEGSHIASFTYSDDNCSVTTRQTPDFAASVLGSIQGENLKITIAPSQGFLVNYVLSCDTPNGPMVVPIPIYTQLESSIMSGQAFKDLELPYENGATLTGSGSDSNAPDSPMTYVWEVFLFCHNNK